MMRPDIDTSCPCAVRGEHFPTIKAAAAHCGVTQKTAHEHLNRFGHLDFLGLPRQHGPRPDASKPVKIGPHSFPSHLAAARALGVDRKTIRRAKTNKSAALTLLRAAMTYAPHVAEEPRP